MNCYELLLVEDNDLDARLVQRQLTRDGAFNITRVETVADCKRHLGEKNRDAVLLDLGLPDSAGGLDALRQTHPVAGNVPIIVLTGLSDEEIGIEAVREGAEDYIVKENVSPETLIRTIRYCVERAERMRSENLLQLAKQQFQVAGDIQRLLFPPFPPVIPGFELAGRCVPADEAGGDYYDFISGPDSTYGLVVGDVSGHGIGPAMLMTAARSVLRTLARSDIDSHRLVTEANKILCDDMPEGRFITLLLAEFAPETASIRYTSAGHDGFLINSQGEVIHEAGPHGFPFNLTSIGEYAPATELEIAPGDIFLLCTDGIPESMNSEGEMLGKKNMLNIIRENTAASAQEIVDALFEEVVKHRGNAPQSDDVTALVLKRNMG